MTKLKHCVFMEFKQEFDREAQLELFNEFKQLQPKIDGFLNIEFGKNLDLEDKSSCNAGFIIDFKDQAALVNYSQNSEHQKLGSKLVSMCVGGVGGIIVFDLVL